MKKQDLSGKDSKYFIDCRTYNYPFCNRRNVAYEVEQKATFRWDNSRTVHLYLVQCSEKECRRTSFHLSNFKLKTDGGFVTPPLRISYKPRTTPGGGHIEELTPILNEDKKPKELDDCFFYHQPTSFFTVDERIPLSIREPLSEGENCRKNNFLTGASACLRKAIYKLLKNEQIPESDVKGNFLHYDERIDSLKEKFKNIDAEYFNSLKIVQGITSQELHENDWEDLDSPTLRFLLETTKEILYEIFVLPDELHRKRTKIQELNRTALKKPPSEGSSSSQETLTESHS
jgi:hypothetical protein